MGKLNYSPPKFRKGQGVLTSDNLAGKVEMLSYESGENWYFVNLKWYAERELREAK
jgi:hypothetical protein